VSLPTGAGGEGFDREEHNLFTRGGCGGGLVGLRGLVRAAPFRAAGADAAGSAAEGLDGLPGDPREAADDQQEDQKMLEPKGHLGVLRNEY